MNPDEQNPVITAEPNSLLERVQILERENDLLRNEIAEIEKEASNQADHLKRETSRLNWLLPRQYSHKTRASVDKEIELDEIADSMREEPID